LIDQQAMASRSINRPGTKDLVERRTERRRTERIHMKISMGRIAAGVAAVVAAVTAVAVGPGAAYASDVNPYSASALCGSGYGVVASHAIEGQLYIYLLYNNSTGKNCAVALKQRNLGVKDSTDVFILPQNESQRPAEQSGNFTSYAGPIYLTAPGECVEYGGSIQYGGVGKPIYSYNSTWVACG
jgi:hypothetical protein